jgi:hypothetical protein
LLLSDEKPRMKFPLPWLEEFKFPSPVRDNVTIVEMVKNVMLNFFQHLMQSITYGTLKRVQGDKK